MHTMRTIHGCFVLQQALSFCTRYHLDRQGLALIYSHRVRSQDTTSPEEKITDRNRAQRREGGAADGTGEKRLGGTERAIDRFEIVDLRESGTTTGNQHSQPRVRRPCEQHVTVERTRCRVEKKEGTGRGVGVGEG